MWRSSIDWEIGDGSTDIDAAGQSFFVEKTTRLNAGETVKWTDQLQRTLKVKAPQLDQQVYQAFYYDFDQEYFAYTEPYFEGEPIQIQKDIYDDYGRIIARETSRGTQSYVYGTGDDYTLYGLNGTWEYSSSQAGLSQTVTGPYGEVISHYNNLGLTDSVVVNNLSMARIQFDDQGRRTQLNEKNSGTSQYTYNAYGEVLSQKDAAQQTQNYTYEKGRLKTFVRDGETITLEYLPQSADGGDKIKSVSGDHFSDQYFYNSRHLLDSVVYLRDDQAFGFAYQYNATHDRIQKQTYPNGVALNYHYHPVDGSLVKITHNDSTLVEILEKNARGQVVKYRLGNGKVSHRYYDSYGFLDSMITPGVQQYRVKFEKASGNVLWREDGIHGLREDFSYDSQNEQLSTWTVTNANGVQDPGWVQYDPMLQGNIIRKSDVSDSAWSYHPEKVHAVAYVPNTKADIAGHVHAITYNSMQAPVSIKHKENPMNAISYAYGAGDQRIKSTERFNGIVTRRYYAGNYEVSYIEGQQDPLELIYVGVPGLGMVATIETGKAGFKPVVHYTYTDHLGTVTKVTNNNGALTAEQAFDPWGRRRDPSTWELAELTDTPAWLYRGYTGHEMLDHFGIIHMNGRLYDPMMGRMLSPDNFVQNPHDARSYNRYTYANNNPLKYTDPDGEIFIMPMISWSSSGGLDVSITFGIGAPGAASAQVTVGYNSKSGNAYISGGVTVGGITASIGFGDQTGFTASVGIGLGVPGLNGGFGTNLTGGGISWSENGGKSVSAFGFTMDESGELIFNPSVSYSVRVNMPTGKDRATTSSTEFSLAQYEEVERAITGVQGKGYGMQGDPTRTSGSKPAFAVQGPTFEVVLHKKTKVTTTYWRPTPMGVNGRFVKKRSSGGGQRSGGDLNSSDNWGYDPAVFAIISTPTNVVNTSAAWAIADGATDIVKFGKAVGRLANGVSYATAAYQVATGNDNTSTWVDVGVTTIGIITVGVVGTVAAPFVAAGALVYGVWSVAGGSDWIDENWGYRK